MGYKSLARPHGLSTASETLALFTGLVTSNSRRLPVCSQCRYSSTRGPGRPQPKTKLGETVYPTDEWHNVPPAIASSIGRQLHIQKDHPISITRSIIESKFPKPTYQHHNGFVPVVTTGQNFDSLGFPPDHPGRSKADTYYVNASTVLRTHTSAHQLDAFRANSSEGFLISADVYRRDAIDRTHYPIFHQMEGARVWDRKKVPHGNIAQAVWEDIAKLPTHSMIVEDPNPPTHPERNPLQHGHSHDEAEALAAHLKRSLELMVVEIFSRAKDAAIATNPKYVDEPLKVRWIEAFFPFTSPSWELEIFWQGDWLEVLGSGVVKQDIFEKAGVPSQVGWAFGIGLERIAMLLFEIPDIRLFWSQDERFLGQFKGMSDDLHRLKRYVPFSKYPACYKDVAFWLRSSSSSAGGGIRANAADFHENDVMEIVRDVGGDVVEDVTKVDEFTHPKTGRKSLCYRINYRSLERTLTNEEANEFHEKVSRELVNKLGVELR
ncbi:putative phenylalanyl-tRNA synthetase, mitochondrial [Venustampulla echinocandica]|uniref:Phenylalanine--tRNA ligase, mitochondrial n=1 Tax=Venustampulla echinocandica TaxID=2656787 RepID=A0A370TXS1_9HELO|nr:putative phenylalanyl-tRNA synthetase, mitochondrial [Venustampulla echinocandica]RDL40323.1 putative phenylalanyl-tRNA synthetase, mitochondrial [Venustampulla echinocandica]